MQDNIRKIIRDIYFNNRKDLFLQGCNNRIVFLNDLLRRIKPFIDTYDVYSSDNEPAEEVRISVSSNVYYDVCLKYDSLLYINKIAKYYFIQHEFSIDNPDNERIDPCLDGYRGEAYCKKQFVLDEKIEEFMFGQGYERLSINETEEIFPDTIIPKDSTVPEFFSVYNALFMDYYGFFEE